MEETPSPVPLKISRPILGVLTLCLGGLSLALTLYVTIVYDIPPPWREAKLAEPKIEGQKQLEWHGVKLKWGGKHVKEEDKAPELTIPKTLFLTTAALSVLGLLIGPLAYYREHRYALIVPGMSLCFTALVWQYLIFGIFVGAAVAICLIIISKAG